MDVTEKSPSDEEIFERILDLTENARLDWKQVYEQGGTHPSEDIKESTSPQGYMAFDEYFGFGRMAVEPEDPEDGIEHAVIHVSGNRLDVSEEQVEGLIAAIEDYIDAVQAGKTPSMTDRVNQKIQEHVEPLRREVRVLEDELAHKDQRVSRVLSILENVTGSGTSPDHPPLTPETFEEVMNRIPVDIDGDPRDPTLNVQRDDVEVAIESLA